jgi:mannose-6-phosphate isomerase-like protein (cupin superfamily)
MTIATINLAQKLSLFADHWAPRIVGQVNDSLVKLVKLEGPFTWHHHEHEDELFLVVKGHLRMELRDGARDVLPGEMIIIPRGVEHRPVGIGETHVLLVEPATTLNTGSATDDPRTRRELARI